MPDANDVKVSGYVSFPKPEPVKAPQEPDDRKRRTIMFVVVFLVAVLAMLAGYRYVIGSKANDYYLYLVGTHTSWALRLFGDSCQVEPASAYSGREQEIRSVLQQWDGRQAAQSDPGAEGESAPALTAWESCRYKTVVLLKSIQKHKEALKTLEPKSTVVTTPEDHLAAIRIEVGELENVIRETRSSTLGESSAPKEITEALPNINQVLNETGVSLGQGGLDFQSFTSTLERLQEQVAELRIKEKEFLRSRLVQLQEKLKNNGPLVGFIKERSPSQQTAELQNRLEAIGKDTELSEEERSAQQAAIQQELDTVQAYITSLPPSSDERRPVAFSFTLVPDCGAIPSMAIFVAAVLAFPARYWKRLVGIILGVPLLYLVNVGRLTCLGYIGAVDRGGQIFKFVHEYVWQGIFIIFVVVVWLLWVELLVKEKPAKAASN